MSVATPQIISTYVRRPDKMATSTTTPKGKYTESLTFSTSNCIYANYGKLGKPSLQQHGCGREENITETRDMCVKSKFNFPARSGRKIYISLP